MSFINAIMRVAIDVVLYPFRELHPLIGISLMSLAFGVFALLIFKWTSNQDKLTQVKSKIHAGLFEIRLFNDDLRAIFRAMFTILRHNATYIRLSLIPLLVMTPLIVPVLTQLQFHYGYQGLKPGDETLVKVEMTGEWTEEGPRPDLVLEIPEGLRVKAGPVWAPAIAEMSWSVEAEKWGNYELKFLVDGEPVTKSLRVAENLVARRSPIRPTSFLDQLLYPAEPPVPSSAPIAKISLSYPHGNAGIEGWESELTWFWIFMALSIVFALVLRKPLGVTI